MYKVLLVDDNKKDLTILKNFLMSYIVNFDVEFSIECFCDVHEFKFNQEYDIVFLDIDMPYINGFELAKQFNQSYLIFVTNRDDLVFDSFEYHPFAFIRKFLLEFELKVVLNRLLPQLYKQHQHIILQSYGQDICLKVVDVIYIESYLHNCIIHTVDQTTSIRMKLSQLNQMIKHDAFYNIHQSYLVNWNYVESVTKYECLLFDKMIIPISQRKYKESIESYHRFLLRRV